MQAMESVTKTLNITTNDASGNTVVVAFASYSTRGNAGFNVNVDIVNTALAADEANFPEIQTTLNDFIERAKAAALADGVPVGGSTE